MHFIKYVIAIICFKFLFWHLIFMIISLPSMAFLPFLTWATENDKTIAKKMLFVPILVGMFLFGTLLPALFYSGGIFATTNYFMNGASHPMVYAIIGGLLCFWTIAPSGETNLSATLVSVVSYVLYMTILKTFGQSIGDIGFAIVDWILAILLPLLFIGLIIAFISWIISKFRKQRGEVRREDSTKKSNLVGIFSLVFGVIGIFWWSAVMGIIAIILGIVQFTRHRSKLAIAGLVLGIIDILLAVFWYSVGLMPSIF